MSGLLNPGAGGALGGGRVTVTDAPRSGDWPGPQDATSRDSGRRQRNMPDWCPQNL
jgi:hypothetical protein